MYHLGVVLEDCDSPYPATTYLSQDADFNSKILGWENGFDGIDNSGSCPDETRIFDVTSSFEFIYDF